MAGEEHFEVRTEGLRVAAQGYHAKADHLRELHERMAALVDPGRLGPLIGDSEDAGTFLAGFTRAGGGLRDAVGGWGKALRVTGDFTGGMAENYERAETFATDAGRGLNTALANLGGGGPVNTGINSLSTRR